MAELVGDMQFPEPDFSGRFEDSPDYEALQVIMYLGSKMPLDETVEGQVLKWQVADGYAYYMVVREDPLELIHLSIGDNWQVDPIMIKGLEREDVVVNVERQRTLDKMFRGRREATD